MSRRIVRKRMFEVSGSEVLGRMYAMHPMECPGCGAVTLPGTGAVPGTSFCPNLRSPVGSYRETGDYSEVRIMALPNGIHRADFSTGHLQPHLCHGQSDGRRRIPAPRPGE